MKVPEHELKFVCQNSDAAGVLGWLRCTCRPDNEYPAATISSIYFDTRRWRFLREKTGSDYLKTKVRLRWYSDLQDRQPDEAVFLEVKEKIGARRVKFRMRSALTGPALATLRLDSPRLLSIHRTLAEAGGGTFPPLLPSVRISYVRHRFVEPATGARVCLDFNIRAAAVNPVMLPLANPFAIDEAVFEMKSPEEELPPTLYRLTTLGCRKQAFSKYEKCCARVMALGA